MPELSSALAEAGRLERARRSSPPPRNPRAPRDGKHAVVVVIGRLSPSVEAGITEAGFVLAASSDARQVWVRGMWCPPDEPPSA